MRIDIIDSIKGLNDVRANWEAVYDADPEAQYFLSWTWISKWLAAVDRPWFVFAARPDGDSSAYVAFFPLWLGTKERKSGGFYNEIHMGGSYMADYTGVLCRPEFQEQAIPAFASRLKQLNWTNLRLEELRASEQRVSLLMQAFPESEFSVATIDRVNRDKIDNSICPAAPLPGDWDSYLETRLSANTRQKIRRVLRQLEKSGEFRITIAERDTFERDLEILLRFWTTRWGRRKGENLKAILANNRLMLRHAFATGTLFMPVLWKGERPLGALAILVDERKKSFLFLIAGRDETFDGPPPGLVLHAHSIRHAIRNGFVSYDFLRGNEPYKYSFGVEERRLTCLLLATKDGKNLGGKLDKRSLPFVLKRSMEHHRAGRHAKAEPGLRQILDLEPRHADALYCLGQITAKRGEHATAIALFKTLLSDHPDIAKAWVRLGRSLQARGELAEAVGALCEGIGREPANAGAYHDLGHVLLDLGLFDQAVAAFDAVRDLQPDYPDIGASLMKAIRRRGELSAKDLARRAAAHADLRDRVEKLSPIAAALARNRQATRRTPAAAGRRSGVEPLFPAQGEAAGVGLMVHKTTAAAAEDGLRIYNAAITRLLPQAKR
jgi:tetratricopeptide (TPR) repeat protein